MPPLIRQKPLLERIKARLDPYDFLIWLSEELNDDAYDEFLNAWATPIGLGLNLIFILARGSSSKDDSYMRDDVFGDGISRIAYLSWLASFLVHFLTLTCAANTVYTFFRNKHYRLFEQPVDVAPSTPAARRVRVDGSPASHSPLTYLKEKVFSATAAHREPNPEQEVWEVSIWDPKAFNLTLFTLFSPGHLLLYYALLPVSAADARPSITVVLAIVFGVVLSVQLGYMKTAFTQQTKDKALIQGEVLNEYNTKFVHPSTERLMRDVSTQTRESVLSPPGTRTREVDVYRPTVIVNRGFKTNPNPNYAKLYSPDQAQETPLRSVAMTPLSRSVFSHTPSTMVSRGTAQDYSSPIKPDERGGSYLGVYNHAASPLRKSISGSLLRQDDRGTTSSGRTNNAASNSRRRETGRF